jgi:hypothetical protein
VWEPIVDGELAARCWRAIDDIAGALASREEPAEDLAVFWSYLASARDDAATTAHCAAAMDRFAARLARGYDTFGLVDGLAGAGWAAAHVASDVDELLDAIDARLVEALGDWRGSYELVYGAAGIGVYFLDRETAAAARGRALVVDHLAATAERAPDGIAWRTRPEWLPDHQRAMWPEGTYDCGVAHGVAGAIGMLARLAARPDAPAGTAALRADAARWLRAQRGPDGFPTVVGGGPARTAWCYGDPGLALALWGTLETTAWIARPLDDTRVVDAGLCHGAAGLAHAATRLYHATRDPAYRDAARAWLERTLAYPRATTDDARGTAILSGSVGVGLALLAAVGDLEPGWDRLLLCDLPVL